MTLRSVWRRYWQVEGFMAVLAVCGLGALVLRQPNELGDAKRLSREHTVLIRDDSDREVLVPVPVKRIAVNYTAFAELLEAIGAGETICGAPTRSAKRWHAAGIGSHLRLEPEAVAACRPEVLLLFDRGERWQSWVRDQVLLRRIPALCFSPRTVRDVMNLIAAMGTLTGSEKAKGVLKQLRRELWAIEEKRHTLDNRAPRVFVEVRSPPGYLTIGANSLVCDLIQIAGGRPLYFGDSRVARVSLEQVLELNPDLYIQQEGVMNRQPIDLRRHPVLHNLRAVRNDAVLRLPEALLSRPGPNVVTGISRIQSSMLQHLPKQAGGIDRR
ncbi:MAG: hypothetical protein D6820_08995 [Lentisphaerae bacterium]|nr:MAG: hypothetical protein D6820_08995 [Lentisphaerota bacterium]